MFSAILTTILLLLVGCSNNNAKIEDLQNEVSELTEEIVVLEEIINVHEEHIESLENFSYLRDFTQEERIAYDRFLTDYDTTHLKKYSPEKILLLYLHSLVISDLETTYALTYNDGTLPDFETFSELFYTSDLHLRTNQTVLTYRDFDSIEIREENQTTDSVDVEIGAYLGNHHSVDIYNLQNENGQWKINLLHALGDI